MLDHNKQRFTSLSRRMIALIGVVVPRRFRSRWKNEWEAELEYREALLARWDRLDWRNKLALLRRASGAFWDAMLLQPRRLEDEMFQDLRYGARMLLKNKMFTLVATLSLALGIGANTAIFSLINALMLRMLPVKNAQELALFRIYGPHMPPGAGYNFNYPLYEMFRDHNQSFSGIITGNNVGRARFVAPEPGAGGAIESVQQQRVSGNFFSTLGVNAVVGRTLVESDDNPANAQPVAVISYEFWRRRFGLDPGVVGRQVTVNNTALTIVGVTPSGFFGFEVGAKPELWWPIKVVNDQGLRLEGFYWIRVIGRLRPGVSLEQAQAEMDLIFRQQNDEVAAARGGAWTPTQRRNHFERNIRLETGGVGYTSLRQRFRQPLFILMAAVGLTLLIACVNVANLLLARAATRRKEIAVRLALGAGRFRLLRQLLTESVLLSLLGGAAGLLFAPAFLRALIAYLPQQAQTALDVSPDARVLAFTLVVSVITGLLFGLAPAWQATRLNLTASLKDQTGASASRSRSALNKTFVVTQVALSLFLLIGAGLFARSLRNLRALDVGMNYENIVQFSLDTGSGYNAQRRGELYKRMLARLEALPGAQSATLLYFSLLSGGGVSFNVSVPGYTPTPDENVSCNEMAVGPRFFETMKMPILAGRDFGPQDERPPVPANSQPGAPPIPSMAGAPPLYAVINQAMARYFFGNENPIGRRFTTRGDWPIEIIGVTKDAKYMNLREQPPRTYYLYYFQLPQREGMTFQLRAGGETVDYAAMIGRLARELDPQAQVVGLRMMRDVVDDSLVQERFIAQLGSAFSLFALLLACVGLYGVMSYAVTRRTNEIGIRMALGARGADVVRMVMRETMLTVAVGMAIGLGAALATTRLISNLLFDLSPNDPATIAAAALLMTIVAALAGYLPARRASRVDPMTALRCE
ncbi:MAG: ABC transporter permease [Blastocatellia bacterium]|nr:ABC transporter permease [Blastocatellia bacterium]